MRYKTRLVPRFFLTDKSEELDHTQVTVEGIIEEIIKLNEFKSSGLDGIRP